MKETYYKTQIKELVNQRTTLREERDNFRSDDMCPEHDSCSKCRLARISSQKYMSNLDTDIALSKLIRDLKYELDVMTCSNEYLNWKYGYINK